MGVLASPQKSIDPIRLEVIRNALQAAVEEMSVALARSAYSTNIKTRLDYSCALFDSELRAIVQAFNQPCHLGSLAYSVPAVLREYGVEKLGPGDGILANDPHRGMSHLNDVSLISPLYYGEKIFGFVVNLAHHVDVGGMAPGSLAVTTEIYQEGMIFPGVKILNSGEIDPDIFKLILANVRGKKEFGGDLRAQVAANKLAQRRVNSIIEKYGVEETNTAVEELYDYTERRARQAISSFPKGVYQAETFVDDDGVVNKPIKIKAAVAVGESEITIDLTGSDPQSKGPMNSTYSQSYSACCYVVKALLPTDIPVNEGFYRVVKVIAPKGSAVNCEYPSPVVGGWEVACKTTEAVFGALAQVLPDKIAAEGKKTYFHIAFGGVDPRKSESYVFMETLAGGYGGRPTKDGEDAVQAHHHNTENSPIEEMEIGYPVLIRRYELIPDSEGPGKFRGGLGLRRDYQFRDHAATVTILADTFKFPPQGLFGGREGRPSRAVFNPGQEDERELRSKITLKLKPSDIISLQTPGAGGYGDPFYRDPEAALRDARDGKISIERARTMYGVVINDDTWTVDRQATTKLRRSKK